MKIIKFFKPGCMPCRVMSDVLKRLKIEHESKEVTPEDVEKYRLTTVPTLVKVDDEGNVISTRKGIISDAQVLAFADKEEEE